MDNAAKNNGDDSALWQTFVHSNQEDSQVVFGQVMERHYKPLLSYGTKMCKDVDFVKDRIHDLFIVIWQKRLHLGEVKSPRFYLLGALRNHILRETNRHKGFREAAPIEDDFCIEIEFAIEHKIIEQETVAENEAKIKDLLTKITKRQREAIYLRFYQDLEYAEIAEMMGVATHSVVNLIYEAVKQLRQHWVFDLACLAFLFS